MSKHTHLSPPSLPTQGTFHLLPCHCGPESQSLWDSLALSLSASPQRSTLCRHPRPGSLPPPGRCPSCPGHLTPAFHRPQTQSALTTQFRFYCCAAENPPKPSQCTWNKLKPPAHLATRLFSQPAPTHPPWLPPPPLAHSGPGASP